MEIYVKENAHPDLLRREEIKQQVKQNFEDQINLLEDLVNYGTQLLIRCLPKNKIEFEDSIIIGVLFKHSLMLLDSVHILIKHGSILSSQLPARGLFETLLYIEWLLKDDTKLRCKRYLVHYYLLHKMEAKLFISKLNSSKIFENSYKRTAAKLSYDPDKSEDIANEMILKIEDMLNSEKFINIKLEFENYKKENHRHANWYSINGPSNLCDLAEKLDRGINYFIHYRHLSRIMHAMVHEEQLDINKNTLRLKPIRNLTQIDKVISASINFILNIYVVIIKNYRPDELRTFGKKYIEKWRERYSYIKEVKYVDVEDNSDRSGAAPLGVD